MGCDVRLQEQTNGDQLADAAKKIPVDLQQVPLPKADSERMLKDLAQLRIAPVNTFNNIGFLDGVSYELQVDSYPNILNLHIYDTGTEPNPNQAVLQWLHAVRRKVTQARLIKPNDGTTKLYGTVYGPEGVVMWTAQVSLDCGGAKKYKIRSDSDGFFLFDNLTVDPKAAYHMALGDAMQCQVRAGTQGFKTLRAPVEIIEKKQTEMRLTLEPGSPSEIVVPGETFNDHR